MHRLEAFGVVYPDFMHYIQNCFSSCLVSSEIFYHFVFWSIFLFYSFAFLFLTLSLCSFYLPRFVPIISCFPFSNLDMSFTPGPTAETTFCKDNLWLSFSCPWANDNFRHIIYSSPESFVSSACLVTFLHISWQCSSQKLDGNFFSITYVSIISLEHSVNL